MKSPFKIHHSLKFVKLFSIYPLCLILANACIKEDPTPTDIEPELITYTGIVIDSFSNKPMKNLKVRLEEHLIIISGSSWWNYSSDTKINYLDSFYTDSSGKFSFVLNKDQRRKNIHSYSLNIILPNTYMPYVLEGNKFAKLHKDSMLKTVQWSVLNIDFAKFRGNKSCDYYHLDLRDYPDTTVSYKILYWGYSDPIKISVLRNLKPGMYQLHAKYSCGAYTNIQKAIFTATPGDTLKVSNYIHP